MGELECLFQIDKEGMLFSCNLAWKIQYASKFFCFIHLSSICSVIYEAISEACSSFIRLIGYVKQEFVNRPQTQESRITRIDAPTASIR